MACPVREQGSAYLDSCQTQIRELKENALWHFDCYVGGMMALLHITLALVAAGLIVELFAAATAPLGYQDEHGFHLGSEKAGTGDEVQPENPS